VAVAEAVRPGRLAWHLQGRHQLELAAGSARSLGLVPGRALAVRESGGRETAESPQRPHVLCEAAHTARGGRCATRLHVPTLPPRAGWSGADRIATRRSTPCAHTC
jgi:hypothetical protein